MSFVFYNFCIFWYDLFDKIPDTLGYARILYTNLSFFNILPNFFLLNFFSQKSGKNFQYL